jgi:hypothetical protein
MGCATIGQRHSAQQRTLQAQQQNTKRNVALLNIIKLAHRFVKASTTMQTKWFHRTGYSVLFHIREYFVMGRAKNSHNLTSIASGSRLLDLTPITADGSLSINKPSRMVTSSTAAISVCLVGNLS